MFLAIVLASCLLRGKAHAGYMQYFYSGLPQIQHNFYQPPLTTYQQPLTTYQHYVPPVAPYTLQAPFSYHQQPLPVLRYTPPTAVTAKTPEHLTQDANSIQVQGVATGASSESPSAATTTAGPATHVLQQTDNTQENFRGFAYRNDFEGARSHFIFLTGPEVNRIGQRPSSKSPTRTAASDSVDGNADWQSLEHDHSIEALVKYLEHPTTGVRHFYAVNNELVTRNLQDEIFARAPAHPVNRVLPTVLPLSPLLPFIQSRFAADSVETVTRKSENRDEEQSPLLPFIHTRFSASAADTTTKKSDKKDEEDSMSEIVEAVTKANASDKIIENRSAEKSTEITTAATATTTTATTEKSTMDPIVVN